MTTKAQRLAAAANHRKRLLDAGLYAECADDLCADLRQLLRERDPPTAVEIEISTRLYRAMEDIRHAVQMIGDIPS